MYSKQPVISIETYKISMQKYLPLMIKSWSFLNGRQKENESLPTFMVAIAGFLQACAYWVIAEFFLYFFSKKVNLGDVSLVTEVGFGVGLVASLFIIAGSIWINRGKNLSALAWFGDFLEKWQERYYEPSNLSKNYNILLTNAVLICKFLCIATLVREGHSFWILYAYSLSYCAFAAGIAKMNDIENSEIEAFTTAGVLIILSCLFHEHLIPVFIGVLGSFFVFKMIFNFFIKKFEHLNEELTRSISEILLCLLLIAGLLLIK